MMHSENSDTSTSVTLKSYMHIKVKCHRRTGVCVLWMLLVLIVSSFNSFPWHHRMSEIEWFWTDLGPTPNLTPTCIRAVQTDTDTHHHIQIRTHIFSNPPGAELDRRKFPSLMDTLYSWFSKSLAPDSDATSSSTSRLLRKDDVECVLRGLWG